MTRNEEQDSAAQMPWRGPAGTRRNVIKVVAVVLLIVLVVHLLMVGSHYVREKAKRACCAAILVGIGQAMWEYAEANAGSWPIIPHAPATQPGIGRVAYAPGKIGKYREGISPTTAPSDNTTTEGSTTANLWLLIRFGRLTGTSFTCPSSNACYGLDANWEQLWDFNSSECTSAGYEWAFGQAGRPDKSAEPRMVLVADKGPYGAALEKGEPHPGVPTAAIDASRKRWIPWNTINHERAGHNVLRIDGSAEWSSTPLAGVNKDNIYTRWSDPTGGTDADPTPRIHGTPPTGMETPFADTDSLIYP